MLIAGNSLEVLKGLESRYTIHKSGMVTRNKTGEQTVFSKDHKGYMKARLYLPEYSKNKDKRKPFRMHRLVAMKYLDDYSDKLQVNHINGVKDDNRVENLEMVTASENSLHGWGLKSNEGRISKLNRDNMGRFCA